MMEGKITLAASAAALNEKVKQVKKSCLRKSSNLDKGGNQQ